MKPFKQQWANIEKQLLEALEKTVADAATETYAEIVDRTPVKSGDLHRAWEIDYGQGYVKLAASYGSKLMGLDMAQNYTLGNDIWVRNQLPYAERIEYGYSRQAPAGMVRISIKQYQHFLNKAAKRNRI